VADATLFAPPDTGEASRMGMHILSNLSDLKTAAFPINVIATRRSFLEKNRGVVKRFLQAYSDVFTNSSRIERKRWRLPTKG